MVLGSLGPAEGVFGKAAAAPALCCVIPSALPLSSCSSLGNWERAWEKLPSAWEFSQLLSVL